MSKHLLLCIVMQGNLWLLSKQGAGVYVLFFEVQKGDWVSSNEGVLRGALPDRSLVTRGCLHKRRSHMQISRAH